MPFVSEASDPTAAYQDWAVAGNYRAEVFGKSDSAADLQLTDRDTDARLSLSFAETPTSRTVSGAVASAQLAEGTLTWTSETDRLKETLQLTSALPSNQAAFTLQLSAGLQTASDGQGGYLVQDAGSHAVFHLLAPSATDAQGRHGAVTLSLSGSSGTLQLDPTFAASAVYPVTLDPTVVYSQASSRATAYGNAPRLVQDAWGKLLLASVDTNGNLVATWSNDDTTWSSPTTLVSGPGILAPTWSLGTDGSLHLAYQSGSGVFYQHVLLQRDRSNNVVGLRLDGSPVTLDSNATAQQPSLSVDALGRPAVVWVRAGLGSGATWETLFLRAVGTPTVAANWQNAPGSSTSPDALGQVTGSSPVGAASLAVMPPGPTPSTNDDALYVYWEDNSTNQAHWSEAVVNGSAYQAWSTPTATGSVQGSTIGLATAADTQNNGIDVLTVSSTGVFQVARQSGATNTQVSLGTITSSWGTEPTLGLDRGDVYLAYRNGSGNLAFRAYLPETGWDSSETVLDSSGGAAYPSSQMSTVNDFWHLAWTHTSGGSVSVEEQKTAVRRPAVLALQVQPPTFEPAQGQTAAIAYVLADPPYSGLAVTVQVVDSTGTVQKTVFQGSQGLGAQSVTWDGTNTAGVLLPIGSYTIQVQATDSGSPPLSSPWTTTSLSPGRHSQTAYGYDHLYRLVSASGPSGPVQYSYDPAGNRLTKSIGRGQGVQSTTYAYDQADRITSVTEPNLTATPVGTGTPTPTPTSVTVSYVTDNDGNVTQRGSDVFVYDEANRLTSATVNNVTTMYVYDGDGNRVSSATGGVKTSYVYDVNGSLPVVLTDSNGTTGHKDVYGAQGLAYETDLSGNLIGVVHTDGLGSVRAITDATGTVIETYATDEFGVPTQTQSSGEASTNGVATQPFQYTGEQADSTGLVDLRARMYDPTTGRFLQQDPLAVSGPGITGLNRYTYVGDNPIGRVDPSGNCSFYADDEEGEGSFGAAGAEGETSIYLDPAAVQELQSVPEITTSFSAVYGEPEVQEVSSEAYVLRQQALEGATVYRIQANPAEVGALSDRQYWSFPDPRSEDITQSLGVPKVNATGNYVVMGRLTPGSIALTNLAKPDPFTGEGGGGYQLVTEPGSVQVTGVQQISSSSP